MSGTRREGRAVRGDRADGQGVRQPAPARAARPARPGAAHASTSSRARASSRRPTPPSTCRRCTPRAWSRARARARASATRSPATRRSALWLALRDASVARLAEVERAARDYLGEEVEAIGRDELHRAAAPRRRRARRRPPDGGVRRRPHRGRALDPARRARGAPRRAAGRPRGRRLLPRPVLRLRPRGGPHAPRGRALRAAARGGLAANGGSRSKH